MSKQKGNLYIIAAPSGTGKTSLVKALLNDMENLNVSISYTTREKRPNEENGVNYHFVNKTTFNDMLQHDEFLEHAIVFEHLYGTSKKWVADTIKAGKDVILEIDWQGHQQIKKLFAEAISIFILPPSKQALETRLVNRKQDSNTIIQQRLSDMQEAISHVKEFDFVVINDKFDQALSDLKAIISASRLSSDNQLTNQASLIKALSD